MALVLFFNNVITGGDERVASGLILFAAVMGMNGWIKTDLFFTAKGPGWWRKFPIFGKLHKIAHEGEFAGIGIGFCGLFALLYQGKEFHIPINQCLTLLGIMSAANIAKDHMRPVVGLMEKKTNKGGALGLSALFSSFVGEPAAAIINGNYFRRRVSVKNAVVVAVGMAAAIGSGGGLIFFAAPPLIIIWEVLETFFHWNMLSLLFYLGVGCVLHVSLATWRYKPYVDDHDPNMEYPKFTQKDTLPLALIAVAVIFHLLAAIKGKALDPNLKHALWGFDILVGVLNIYLSRKKYAYLTSESTQELKEEAHSSTWLPLILAVLLAQLDIIGFVADPLILDLGGRVTALVQANFSPFIQPLALSIAFFFISAWTSHFADNALATRVYITIPKQMIIDKVLGRRAASLIAAGVSAGGLWGGYVMVPSNLPNFALRRIFDITPGQWFQKGREFRFLYWTCIAYLTWLAACWGMTQLGIV